MVQILRDGLKELNTHIKAETSCTAALPHNHEAAGRWKGCLETILALILPRSTQMCQPLTKDKAIWLSPDTVHPWFSKGKVYTHNLQDWESQVTLLSAQSELRIPLCDSVYTYHCSSFTNCFKKLPSWQTGLQRYYSKCLLLSYHCTQKPWHTAQGELGRKVSRSQILSPKTL